MQTGSGGVANGALPPTSQLHVFVCSFQNRFKQELLPKLGLDGESSSRHQTPGSKGTGCLALFSERGTDMTGILEGGFESPMETSCQGEHQPAQALCSWLNVRSEAETTAGKKSFNPKETHP